MGRRTRLSLPRGRRAGHDWLDALMAFCGCVMVVCAGGSMAAFLLSQR